MVEKIYNDIKNNMHKTIEHYQKEVSKIRTGRASSTMLDSILVDYYGTPQPLKNMSNVSTPEAQLIVITPFDPSSLEMIEAAISSADLGMSPNNDGSVIRLNVPVLTEERRKDLVKILHQTIEEGRVSIRNIRRDGNDQIKKLQSDENLSEDNVKIELDNIQDLTNQYIDKLNSIQSDKEKEIMP
tara:strand:- start:3104 stop:3658 length:555 start_codon:yes stop_codon:yes gene_type:complete